MVTRRAFLESTMAGMGLLAHGGIQRAFAQQDVNDQIRIGIIGLGGQGTSLFRGLIHLADSQNIRVVSLCDVWNRQIGNALAAGNSEGYDTSLLDVTDDYRRILDREDIDSVVIATPDFSHYQVAVDALSAGKDIYLEKPMTFTLEQAQSLRDAVNVSDRIVQVGTQYASDPGYRAAAEIIQSGVLGTISRVQIARNHYQQRWFYDYSDVRAEDINWALFLTGLPDLPFDAQRFRQWKLFRDTCHGIAGVFMPHYLQALHTVINVPHPRSAVTHGGIFVWDDGRENPDTFHTLLEYDPGFLVSFEMAFGNSAEARYAIYGTQGTLDILNWQLTPAGGARNSTVTPTRISEGIAQIEGAAPEGAPLHEMHLSNWLDCLRSRAAPLVTVDAGYNHMVAVTLAKDAYWTGVKQVYEE